MSHYTTRASRARRLRSRCVDAAIATLVLVMVSIAGLAYAPVAGA